MVVEHVVRGQRHTSHAALNQDIKNDFIYYLVYVLMSTLRRCPMRITQIQTGMSTHCRRRRGAKQTHTHTNARNTTVATINEEEGEKTEKFKSKQKHKNETVLNSNISLSCESVLNSSG